MRPLRGGGGGGGGVGPGDDGAPVLRLYARERLSGVPRTLTRGTTNTGMVITGSASARGRWLLCSEAGYAGRCYAVDGRDVPSLRGVGLSRVRSARPN